MPVQMALARRQMWCDEKLCLCVWACQTCISQTSLSPLVSYKSLSLSLSLSLPLSPSLSLTHTLSLPLSPLSPPPLLSLYISLPLFGVFLYTVTDESGSLPATLRQKREQLKHDLSLFSKIGTLVVTLKRNYEVYVDTVHVVWCLMVIVPFPPLSLS